jgi:hypothetical protein
VTALAAEARADVPRITLDAPPACDEASRGFAARVEQALGARDALADAEASVTITEAAGGFRVVIAMRTESLGAEKVLVSPTCDEALDAAAVVLAFALARAEAAGGDARGTASGDFLAEGRTRAS